MEMEIGHDLPQRTPHLARGTSEPKNPTNPTAALFARQIQSLNEAGKVIEDTLRNEERFPELCDLFSNASTTSMEYIIDIRPAFRLRKMIPLPDILHHMYKSLECKCFMGLFPEVNRAWITVDNQLCLWNYESKEYTIWNDQDQIIVSVGIAPAKPNVFSEDVKYVLVLATPVEIVLLAAWFEGDIRQGQLHLEPTQITVPADNVNMVKIVGTKHGRIFMGGDDGCLYEFHYQPDDGWFSKRVRKINHTQSYFGSFISYLKGDKTVLLSDVVIDESRNILYTLSSKGSIHVYDLGQDGQSFRSVAQLDDLVKVAETLCPRLKSMHSGKEMFIKSIFAVPKSESRYVHLVATASNAIRLYFTTSELTNDPMNAQSASGSTKLELIHVRLPPDRSHVYAKAIEANSPAAHTRSFYDSPSSYTPAAAHTPHTPYNPVGRRPIVNQPYSVDASYYFQGVVLLSQPVSENRDDVIAIHQALDKPLPSALPGDVIIPRPSFLEKATKAEVAGKIWAIDEKPTSVFLSERLRLLPTDAAAGLTNEDRENELSLWFDEAGQSTVPLRNDLAVQHALPPRQFLFLTNTALHTMIKVRPLDHLIQILTENNARLAETAKTFNECYGSAETCAMYLILAASPKERSYWNFGVPVDPNVAEAAARLFLSHPEQPSYDATARPPVATMVQLVESKPAIRHSGRHNGLALYLARLLKPLWNCLINNIGKVNQYELNDLRSMLMTLQLFLDENPTFAPLPSEMRAETQAKGREDRMDFEHEATPRDGGYPRTGQRNIQGRFTSLLNGKPDEEVRKTEQRSLSNLHAILRRAIETISFLQIIGENKFMGVMQYLPQAFQNRLQRMRFCEFITTPEGFELTRALVDALITPYKEGKGDQASVEAICHRLRTSCPNIFREEDRTKHKADELLQKAKLSRSFREREDLLNQSLELYLTVAADLAGEQLEQVCENYIYLRFYFGVLRLALQCAQAVDVHNLGLDWYQKHPVGAAPDYESLGACAYEDRAACYRHSLDAFAELFLAQSPFFRHISSDDLKNRPADDAETVARKRSTLLQMAIISDDQLFHEVLYQWFTSPHPVDLSGILLEACIQLESAFLEPFLQKNNPGLLPNYYIRKGEFEKAAKICQEMAIQTEGLTLEQRIDYLSKAKAAAQSAAGRGDLLATVKDHLDIAQVQSKAVQELAAVPASRAVTAEEEENRSNARQLLWLDGLKDISVLFNQYIRPYGLWEAGLYAFKVAHYVDEAMTKRFWRSIINEELYRGSGIGQRDGTINLELLRTKIVSLGQALERDENVFPSEWLCGYLETLMANLRQHTANDYGWVPRVMKEVGISVPVLFEIYHNALYEENNPDWAEFASGVGRPIAKLEILKVQHWIVSEWIQELNFVRDTQKRLLVAAAKSSGLEECLAEYIQTLQTSRGEDAPRLSQAFRDQQTLLKRYLYRA